MDPNSVNSDGNEAKESALLNEESSEKIVDKSNEKETIINNEERFAEVPNQIEAKKDAKIDGGIKGEVGGSPSTRLSTSTKAAISSAASNGNCSLLDVAALIASQNLARTTGATEEDDDEEIVNLADLTDLDNVGDMEAEALLGGQNDLVCTYPEGYKYRQPLYSCKTCFEESGQRAGVCYACALNCHDDHDLVELYTKRKFCCDCGNAKFKSKCMLYQEKQPENQFNCYNHNFGGIYCACRRPYPPPLNDEPNAADGNDGKTEAVPDDAMVQCVICEDWFHLSHIFSSDEQKNNVAVRDEMRRISTGSDTPAAIGITTNLSTTSLTKEEDGIDQPPPPSSRELVCNSCTERLKFVLVYAHHIAKQQQANEVEKCDCQTKTTNEGKEECVETIIKSTEVEATTEKGDTDATREIPLSTDTEGSTTETGAVQLNATNKCAILPTNTDKKSTGNDEKVAVEVKCLLKKFSSEMTPNEREENVGKGVLLDSVWRNLLCRCEDCQILYESHECMFLLDPEDTMEFYDAQRRANMAAKGEPSVEEQILMTKELVNDPLAVYKIVANETNNVDVALEVQKGFEEMSQKIQRMIRDCSAEGRPVKSADVKRCFGELIEQREAKRRRLMETEEDDDDNEPAWTQ